jgi:type I restriction enzyme S subunit
MTGNRLPEGWRRARLGEVCTVLSGYGFPRELQGRACGAVPFFKVGDISAAWRAGQRVLREAEHYITESEAQGLGARVLPADTVVFAKIGAAIALNRRAMLGQGSLVDNNVMGLAPGASVDPVYLYYYMCTQRLGELTRGGVVPSLRRSDVSPLVLPLPPLAEQRRIVEKIEELFSQLDAGVAALERVRANLKRYRASVLKAAVEGRLTEEWRRAHPDAEPAAELLKRIRKERREAWEREQLASFEKKGKQPPKNWREKYKEPEPPDTTDLPELPEGWCWATVEAVGETATGGTPSRAESTYFGPGVPWVKSGELRDGYVTETEEQLTPEGLSACHASVVPRGALCIALYGATVGRLGVLSMDAATNQAICSVSVAPALPVEYLFYVLLAARQRLLAARQGGAQPNISQGIVRRTAVPLPCCEEQLAIVAEVEARLSVLDALEATVEANLARAGRLRQAILKRAFEGRLVPQECGTDAADAGRG